MQEFYVRPSTGCRFFSSTEDTEPTQFSRTPFSCPWPPTAQCGSGASAAPPRSDPAPAAATRACTCPAVARLGQPAAARFTPSAGWPLPRTGAPSFSPTCTLWTWATWSGARSPARGNRPARGPTASASGTAAGCTSTGAATLRGTS